MNSRIGVICLSLGVLLLPSEGMSQQPVRWETTLEAAQRAAGQTNRLVLIHFSAPWCAVCKRMEADVLTQPSVATELNADYVPVKINADQFPATADRYGVTALPTTVIVSPDGQLLDSMRGWVEADQYVGRLSRTAADARQRRAMIAQVPSRPQLPPSATAAPPAMPPSSPPPTSAPPAYGRPVTPIATPSPAGPAPAPVATAPAYGAPVAPPVTSRYDSPPVPGSQPAGLPPQSSPPQTNPPRNSLPPSNPPQGNMLPPPAGSPPWGLDGYCPVALCEKHTWVRGDRRWGAVHRGRTYLFAGPDEQRRFLANPDGYAPVVSGNDVVLAAEQGQIVPGMRQHGVFYQGRVYLFSSEATLQKFSLNPAAYDANRPLEAYRAGANPGQPMR
jgi:YHS domain-containing protein/thiol-disulfide isomerase/thioredoxin